MNISNTLENKAKYFAAHWGQKALRRISFLEVAKIDTDCLFIDDIKNRYLELKPLSAITDEDAIKVANIIGGFIDATIFREDTYIELNGHNDAFLWFDGEIVYNDDRVHFPLLILQAYDFLRSRGYAIPYMGLSVETLIEYGWLKLSE